MRHWISDIVSNSRVQEFVRFCIVGVIAMGLHYAIYVGLLLLLGMELTAGRGTDLRATLAYTIGYAIALIANMWIFNTYFHPWEFVKILGVPEYGVPYIFGHNAGEQMQKRLQHLIQTQKAEGAEFITYNEFAKTKIEK